jgi:4-aminobutyrate aminotransferase-like enzyme
VSGARLDLGAGNLLPEILTPPPGPRSREIAETLRCVEAPGVSGVPRDFPSFGEPPIAWAEALGANVWDADGNRYVDLTAGFGVAAVGHRHPWVMAAVAAQGGRLVHGLGDVHPHPARAALAARLAGISPVPDAQVYFAISGAEAVEIAVKTALAATGRPGFLAFAPAYHGLTLGALAATSRPEFRAPFAAHLHPHVHRLPFGAPEAELRAALDRPRMGAALVEPVVGREGVIFPPPGWLAALARLCRERGIVLIADEIFTGFGRTGARFAIELDAEAEGVAPDLLCCGKALGGGLPIAAVLGRRDLFRAAWERDGEALHTATFVAHPLACAAALAALDVMEDEHLAERAAELGEEIAPRLAAWPGRYPAVTAVRGRGLLWGIELATRDAAYRWTGEALRRGVLMLAGGPEGRVAQIVPPLTIARPQLAAALDLLEGALAAL